MKAISLWQPWASLIACGAKRYETRDWAPPISLIGKRIAIHAAKKKDRDAADFTDELIYGQHRIGGFPLADRLHASFDKGGLDVMGVLGNSPLPFGAIVCTAVLEGAYRCGRRLDRSPLPMFAVAEILDGSVIPNSTLPIDEFGNYAEGRWAWALSDIRIINPPTPVKGAQGFFDLPQGWLVAA